MPKTIAITPSWYWPHGVARVAGVPPFHLHEYVVERWARHHPDEAALVDATTRVTGRELAALVARVATDLAGRVEPGEVIALSAGPTVEGAVLLLGALAAGAPAVLLDPAEARALPVSTRVGLGDAAGAAALAACGIDAARLGDLAANPDAPATLCRVDRTDPAVGLRAGDAIAWHSHRSILAGAVSLATFFGASDAGPGADTSPSRPWLTTRPLSTWEGVHGITTPLAAGAPVVFAEPGESALDAIAREGVGTAWFDLDAAFEATRDAKKQVKHLRGLLERLVLSTPGPFSPDQRQRVGRLFECPALTVWGRPETGPVFASHPSWYLDESIGIPVSNAHVVPVDPRSQLPIATLWELVESAMVTVWSPSLFWGYEHEGRAQAWDRERAFPTTTIASSDANGMIYLLPD